MTPDGREGATEIIVALVFYRARGSLSAADVQQYFNGPSASSARGTLGSSPSKPYCEHQSTWPSHLS